MTVHQIHRRAPVDEIDRRIIALLEEDARRSYGSIGRQVFLSPSAVKRRIDGLRESRALLGFTAVVEDEDSPPGTEALVYLSLRPGVTREAFVASLVRHSEIGRAWMVSGDADAIAYVSAHDAQSLDRLTEELKRGGLIERLRFEIVLASSARMVERSKGEAV
jgi:DNA-binding Lrp family transcriptional regulator